MDSTDQGGRLLTLRTLLKTRTAALHERLDALLTDCATGGDERYASFLAVQHAARLPIERWMRGHMDDALRPPDVTPLISADLAELGKRVPPPHTFLFPADANPIGLGWALGGSALGNRAMLLQRRRTGATGAERFLSDRSLATYFAGLMPKLSEVVTPGEAHGAIQAAEAVFLTFIDTTGALLLKTAA